MLIGLLLGSTPTPDTTAKIVDDTRLIQAAQRGSADAFTALHRQYYNRVYRFAFLKTNNASDAEDIAAETFVRAFSSLPRFRFSGSNSNCRSTLYPWLHRIASNLIVDTHRSRPTAGQISLDAPLVEGMKDLLSDRLPSVHNGQSPQEIVERHEVQSLVRDAINSLPADQADVLIHRFLAELSLREIAPIMSRSESAVKSLLHRAVVALRDDLRGTLDKMESTPPSYLAASTPPEAEVTVHAGRQTRHDS